MYRDLRASTQMPGLKVLRSSTFVSIAATLMFLLTAAQTTHETTSNQWTKVEGTTAVFAFSAATEQTIAIIGNGMACQSVSNGTLAIESQTLECDISNGGGCVRSSLASIRQPWRCVGSYNAMPVFNEVADFTYGPAAIGDVPTDVIAPGFESCFASLGFNPLKLFCVKSDSSETIKEYLVNNATSVYWVGSAQETIVEDFNKTDLGSVLDVSMTATPAVAIAGESLTFQILLQNKSANTSIGSGFDIRLSEGIQFLESTNAQCVEISHVVSCYIGNVNSKETREIEIVVSIDPSLSAEELASLSWQAVPNSYSGTPIDSRPDAMNNSEGTEFDSVTGSLGFDSACQNVSCWTNNNSANNGAATGPRAPAPGVRNQPEAAAIYSHPNLVGFDGRRFIFHGAGDYVLTESLNDDFEVHARFGRMGSAAVSFNRGVAARVDNNTVVFGDDPNLIAWQIQPVTLNGEPHEVTEDGTNLENGAWLGIVDNAYELRSSDGSTLRVGKRVADPWSLELSEQRWGQVHGLLGNANGDRTDDLKTRQGEDFDYNSMQLYELFGTSWLVAEDNKLFQTELKVRDRLPIIPNGMITLADLDPAVVKWAEQVCRDGGVLPGAGLAECIFDVALTGDSRWVEELYQISQIINTSVSVIADHGILEQERDITLPAVIDGEIAAPAGYHIYRFELAPGESLIADAGNRCQSVSTFEFVLKSPSSEIIARNSGSGCGFLTASGITEAGVYELVVYDSNGHTGQYVISLDNPNVQVIDYEVGTTIDTAELAAGAEAVYRFNINDENERFFLDVHSCDILKIDIEAYGDDASQLRSDRCFDFVLEPDPGTVAVSFASKSTEQESYAFKIWKLLEPEQNTYEITQEVQGELRHPQDTQSFTFEVTTEQTLYFDASGPLIAGQYWRLIDPNGNEVVSTLSAQDFAYTVAPTSNESNSEATQPSHWTIQVVSTNDRAGAFSFKTWQVDEPTQSAHSLGETQIIQLTHPHDSHVVTIENVDTQEVYFQANSPLVSKQYWHLEDPNGQIHSRTLTAIDISQTLTPGVWKLHVYTEGDRYGEVSFKSWIIDEATQSAHTIGESQQVEFLHPNDSHEIAIDIQQTQTVQFESLSSWVKGQYWELYDPTGTRVKRQSASSDFSYELSAGVWKLKVSATTQLQTFEFQTLTQP